MTAPKSGKTLRVRRLRAPWVADLSLPCTVTTYSMGASGELMIEETCFDSVKDAIAELKARKSPAKKRARTTRSSR
jgi:hypothetical protein